LISNRESRRSDTPAACFDQFAGMRQGSRDGSRDARAGRTTSRRVSVPRTHCAKAMPWRPIPRLASGSA